MRIELLLWSDTTQSKQTVLFQAAHPFLDWTELRQDNSPLFPVNVDNERRSGEGAEHVHASLVRYPGHLVEELVECPTGVDVKLQKSL